MVQLNKRVDFLKFYNCVGPNKSVLVGKKISKINKRTARLFSTLEYGLPTFSRKQKKLTNTNFVNCFKNGTKLRIPYEI